VLIKTAFYDVARKSIGNCILQEARMTTGQVFLDVSRRQIIRLIALGLGALGVTFVVIVAVMLFLAPNTGLIIFIIALLLFLVGAGITLATIDRWPTMLAVLPITIGLLEIIGVTGIVLPELAQAAAPFLTMNVLMIALTGHRRYTLMITIVSTLLAVVIVSSLPRPFPELSIMSVVEPVKILAAGTLVLVFWGVFIRMIGSQNVALALADQRADEADIARREADTARTEIEQRSAEQARLLDLVRTLELPVLSVGAGLLVVPLVGTLDSRRIAALQQHLFAQVTAQRAHSVVLDITAITTVNETIATALLQTAQGVRLLGAQTLLSGMRAEVAHTIASLGEDLSSLRSVTNLGQAIKAIQRA
jgi:anti-anti-sigma regulatory factor